MYLPHNAKMLEMIHEIDEIDLLSKLCWHIVAITCTQPNELCVQQ